MGRITIDQIKEELAQYGWLLLSDSYKNLDAPLDFQCDCGHRVYSTWKKIREHPICPTCQEEQFKKLSTKIQPKSNGVQRLISFDQSTHISGYAIFDGEVLIHYGVFETIREDEISRYIEVKQWINGMIQMWQPDWVAIEDIQLQSKGGMDTRDADNVQNLMVYKTLARLQGVILASFVEQNLHYKIYAPSEWRGYCGIGGKSRADKKRAARLAIEEWFKINATEDEADAICLGKCAAHEINRPKISFGKKRETT